MHIHYYSLLHRKAKHSNQRRCLKKSATPLSDILLEQDLYDLFFLNHPASLQHRDCGSQSPAIDRRTEPRVYEDDGELPLLCGRCDAHGGIINLTHSFEK